MPALPSGSSAPAPAPERRLAVLLSHLHPWHDREPPRTTARLVSAERLRTAAAAEGALSTSPCAVVGGKSSGGGHCVFCNIVAGTTEAFKLYEDDVCLCILDTKPLTTGCRFAGDSYAFNRPLDIQVLGVCGNIQTLVCLKRYLLAWKGP